MENKINIIAAIIEIINSGSLKTVEDVAKLSKWASVKLETNFEQGMALVSQIIDEQLQILN
jgi:hypothetical protein